ncbi:MAG TPA: alpha/beta hydrolase [Acidimicrobiales bacterium]|nr:alpha/beta hydrolase [Acidimicrobiales bacterium]
MPDANRPADAPLVRSRPVTTNGVELHVDECGEGPPVIFAHGFPELAFSWRHQLPALAAAGYHAVAPDQRGYGRSSRPAAIADYDVAHLTGDLVGLLDDIGEDRAVFVGHDWGAMVVWALSLLHADRVAGVVGMSVPFLHRAPMPPTELMRQVFGDAFFYILYFQEPEVADADLGRDPATTMRRMLAGLSGDRAMDSLADALAPDARGFVERLPEPDNLPAWLHPDDLDRYVDAFTRTGFTGAINWYRNVDRNWELTEPVADAQVAAPSLFVGGRLDPVLLMTPPDSQEPWLSDHRGTVLVEGAGHWVQQEAPAEVNDALLGFLAGLDSPYGRPGGAARGSA